MSCTSPKWLYKQEILTNCGKCEHCRLSKVMEWSMRLMHEAQYYKNKVFITLTYEDKYLPENNNLKKRDLQLFWKRLRIKLQRTYHKDWKIKYYAVGEYGTKSGRAHYHAIVYNMGMHDQQLIHDAWGMGIVHVGTVTNKSTCYVAGYIEKKYSKEFCTNNKITQQYSAQSKGMGREWCIANKKQLWWDMHIKIKKAKRPIPRYYRKILGINPDTAIDWYEEILKEQSQNILNLAKDKLIDVPDNEEISIQRMYKVLKKATIMYEKITDEIIEKIAIPSKSKPIERFWIQIAKWQLKDRIAKKQHIQARQATFRKHRITI